MVSFVADDKRRVSPEMAALRAISHPTRLNILTHLRREGPATATSLAHRFGLASGATSYHLRKLATHGYVMEDTTLGSARERWWRAVHAQTLVTGLDATVGQKKEAADVYWQSVAAVYAERLREAAQERPLLPERWKSASTASDWVLFLSPDRAREVIEQLTALIASMQDQTTPDTEPVTLQLQVFPSPGHVEPGE